MARLYLLHTPSHVKLKRYQLVVYAACCIVQMYVTNYHEEMWSV